MDELIHQYLIKLQEKRAEEGIGPVDIMPWLEIMRQIKISIGHLRNDGIVHIGDTINDKYIKIL